MPYSIIWFSRWPSLTSCAREESGISSGRMPQSRYSPPWFFPFVVSLDIRVSKDFLKSNWALKNADSAIWTASHRLKTNWLFLKTAKSRTVDRTELNILLCFIASKLKLLESHLALKMKWKNKKKIHDGPKGKWNDTVPGAAVGLLLVNSIMWHVTSSLELKAKCQDFFGTSGRSWSWSQSFLRRRIHTDDSTD